MDPAMTREAMLEAIRSGSAVERLKKVQIKKDAATLHTFYTSFTGHYNFASAQHIISIILCIFGGGGGGLVHKTA